MGPARPCSPPAPQLLLRLLFPLCFPRALWGDVVFLPPFIRMFDTSVSAALVGETEDVNVSLTVWDGELGILPIPDCGLQSNGTGNWSLTVTSDVMGSEVTVRLNGDLQPCVSETDFFSDCPCVVETLLVSASRDSSCLAHLLIQVEIYPNASLAQNVSENNIGFVNQMYQPFGPCPCDLVAGMCDVRCCCDKECMPHLIELFKEDCFTGVFGGNVNPPFSHLCSNPAREEVSDWFPFLCVQSSLDNTPFLGYFYHGFTSPREELSFKLPIYDEVEDWSDFGYQQDSPLMTVEKELFTIPQMSLVGQCIQEAPVAFLQNFDVICVTDLATRPEREDISSVKIKNGTIGGFVVPQVVYKESTALDKFIRGTDVLLAPGPSFKYVNLEEHYTFRWNEKTITEFNVKVIRAKIHADQQGLLTQRFKVTFLSFNAKDSPERSGNPGYFPGKPVRALNLRSVNNITTLNLWRPVSSLGSYWGGCSSQAGLLGTPDFISYLPASAQTAPHAGSALFPHQHLVGLLSLLSVQPSCHVLHFSTSPRLSELILYTS